MAAVPRREQPRKFLDASLVPLERALLARANTIGTNPSDVQAALRQAGRAYGVMDVSSDALGAAIACVIAAELRSLADELHHW